jgi:hypothetical protein
MQYFRNKECHKLQTNTDSHQHKDFRPCKIMIQNSLNSKILIPIHRLNLNQHLKDSTLRKPQEKMDLETRLINLVLLKSLKSKKMK